MRYASLSTLMLAAAMGTLAAGAARADCESDMIQLEQAMKAPNLTPAATSALNDAKDKSVSAMRKDDDKGCHDAIAAALPKAGMTLK